MYIARQHRATDRDCTYTPSHPFQQDNMSCPTLHKTFTKLSYSFVNVINVMREQFPQLYFATYVMSVTCRSSK